jgi:transposase
MHQQRAGRFILATNELDAESLNESQVLAEYKGQQGNERGFGFLKDPLFFASSVFLKSPERIMALGMLLGLCLLVYPLGQRQLPGTRVHWTGRAETEVWWGRKAEQSGTRAS